MNREQARDVYWILEALEDLDRKVTHSLIHGLLYVTVPAAERNGDILARIWFDAEGERWMVDTADGGTA
jgi:hypothetical protein